MSQSAENHKAEAPSSIRCAVVTISDTRTFKTDTGGQGVVDRLIGAGHLVADRQIIPDESDRIRGILESLALRDDVDAVLMTGGTGISVRDQTLETVSGVLTKALPGYGELFRMLSYQQIGAAAMLSRATGGLIGRTVVLTMPGSPAAVQLAMEEIILPELGHLVREAKR